MASSIQLRIAVGILLVSCVAAFTTLSDRRKSQLFTYLGLVPGSILDSTREHFQGKNVLLTGASGGLGKAMALQLVNDCNVKTLILSGRKEDALQEVANSCNVGSHQKVVCVSCDLADLNAVQLLGQKALEHCNDRGSGCVDVLINNGGISSRSNFIDTDISVDDLLMRINFLAGASLAKQVVPAMSTKRGGTIIWISSVQGLLGIPGRTSYAASKFAVQGYCEALRAEVASLGITVHVASPGYIRTNLSQNAIQGDGTNYGKMDDTTANGADPMEVSATIFNSVANNNNTSSDFLVAAGLSAKVAIWLRFLAPKFLEQMLIKRFQKSQTNQK